LTARLTAKDAKDANTLSHPPLGGFWSPGRSRAGEFLWFSQRATQEKKVECPLSAAFPPLPRCLGHNRPIDSQGRQHCVASPLGG
jgi:hypothetical protein